MGQTEVCTILYFSFDPANSAYIYFTSRDIQM